MSRVGRWWRKHSRVEPAIQPIAPESFDDMLDRYGARRADDLIPWLFLDIGYAPDQEADARLRETTKTTRLHQSFVGEWPNGTASHAPGQGLVRTIEASEVQFGVPMRDGKPATIYVYVDPESKQTYEFHSVQELDDLITTIRQRYHNKIRAETARLKKVRDSLS